MPPSAVLFDFDGVLADTENIHVAAWQRTLARMGWEVPDEAASRSGTMDDHAFAAELFARRGVDDADVDGWVLKKQELAASMLRLSPRAYLGVAELVRALSGRARLAIVSTTWRENVDAFLAATGLADAFSLVVSKEDVQAMKPDPEGYRLALGRLKVEPTAAVAVEDSPRGLAAAEAAGVPRVAVGHRLPPGEWTAGARFLPGFDPLADALEALGFADGTPS